jgi:thiol-disulfide isomerase/thioredoxin
MKLRGVASVLAIALSSAACQSGKSPEAAREPAKRTADERAQRLRPVFVRGPTGGAPIAPYVADQLAKGKAAHRGLLVYVGATWCEPCQRFHQAVQAGELDDLLAGVRLIEFDLDEDRQALTDAGYSSRLIPLFAFPNDDGTASSRRIEGSIKGPDAVDKNLAPRLAALLRGQLGG